MEFRPIPIILISFYCFLLTLFSFSSIANTLLGNTGTTSDFFIWMPVTAYGVFAVVFAIVGIGILYYNQLCWKTLFFSLMVGVSTVASLILVVVALFFLDIKLFFSIYNSVHTTAITWFSFLAFFLSGIIVLYYLTRKEILSYFGEMGDLVTPF